MNHHSCASSDVMHLHLLSCVAHPHLSMTTAQIGWPLSNELLLVVCLSQKRGGRQEASVALSTSKLTRALAAPGVEAQLSSQSSRACSISAQHTESNGHSKGIDSDSCTGADARAEAREQASKDRREEGAMHLRTRWPCNRVLCSIHTRGFQAVHRLSSVHAPIACQTLTLAAD
jgi:hypothetical protein